MSYDDILRVDRHVPASRRAASAQRQRYSPLLIVLTLLATLGVLLYAGFLLDPNNRGDLLPWLVVVLAEGVLVVHTLLAMWTVLSGTKDPRDYSYWATKETLFLRRRDDPPASWQLSLAGRPTSVDVFITVYGEPVETIRRTAVAALAMRGEHRTWILDDGQSDEVRDLAAELGCHYLRRLSDNGAKAGNVNHALSVAKGEFFVIFDADFVPDPDFLFETVPFFADDEGRLRADPADVRQPAQPDLPRRRLHADGVLPVHPAGPEPVQRRVLRGHQRDLPARRDRADRRHVHRLEVRGRVDLARLHERGWKRCTSPTCWPSATPRDHRGLHQAAAAVGHRRVRDPVPSTTRSPAG